jgi:hypothetical protein
MSAVVCSHLDTTKKLRVPIEGCQECSKNRPARVQARARSLGLASGHQVLIAAEDWIWCYEEVGFVAG